MRDLWGNQMRELGLWKNPVERGMEGRRLRFHRVDIRGAMVDNVRQHENRDKGDKEQQRKGSSSMWLDKRTGDVPTKILSSLRHTAYMEKRDS